MTAVGHGLEGELRDAENTVPTAAPTSNTGTENHQEPTDEAFDRLRAVEWGCIQVHELGAEEHCSPALMSSTLPRNAPAMSKSSTERSLAPSGGT